MLSIAIYGTNNNDIELLRSKIQDFLFENKSLAKILIFNEHQDLITTANSFDVYFIDIDNSEEALCIGKKMMNIENQSFFIYFSKNENNAYKCFKARADYFLKKPLSPDDIIEILADIRTRVKKDAVIIKTATGERRVFVNQLNYINIVRRCLCYHLSEGGTFDGQTLRGSFEKAITPLQEHPYLLFLQPSLLVNINNIKVLNNDNIIFDNDEQLFFPKKAYDQVVERWKKFHEL